MNAIEIATFYAAHDMHPADRCSHDELRILCRAVLDAEAYRARYGVVSDEDVADACDAVMRERADCAHEGLGPRAWLRREVRAVIAAYEKRRKGNG